MPGGRLTPQERQQITAGLADSLAYAEIARRLDRPTSTVTREVMRNGGPNAYRGDLAQHATERRTRRRGRAATGRPGTPPPAHGRDAEAVREYEEAFATVFMQSGLPRMTARTLAGLYTTDTGSLTAAELAGRLQVSPASVSKAVAFLESQGLVRRERDERRRERYVVDDDVLYQSTMAGARSTAQLGEIARQGVGLLGPGTPAAALGKHRPIRRICLREHRPRRGPGPRHPPRETPVHVGQRHLTPAARSGGLGDSPITR